jgi:short-subunit dehydrogenase
MTDGHLTILITGASRGIGRALALRYASLNTSLILLSRDLNALEEVALACDKMGAATKTIVADVRDAEQMRAIVVQLDADEPIDLVIANAGATSGLISPDQPEPWAGVQEVTNTNFMGVINTVAPLVERMMLRNRGQIAIMGSIAANIGLPSCPAYSAAKAGVEAYGMALRAGLTRHNIKINIISPGYIITDMSRKLTGPQPFSMSAEKAAKIIQKGLQNNRARIAFPLPLKWGYFFLSIMPRKMAYFLLSFFSFTVHRND